MVIKFTNFLVSATLLLKILKDGNPRINFSDQCYNHIETSQLICRANQLTGFYMMGTLVLVKRTMTFPYLKMKRSKFVILSIQKLDSHLFFLVIQIFDFFLPWNATPLVWPFFYHSIGENAHTVWALHVIEIGAKKDGSCVRINRIV